ncbi:Zonadhesin [Nosema bombycis CQ1]|uniref:Zonadhesin n=1 Tax=Nosema bombycis (strain CQ1 / CVCC 102059) TaxID=578461 RepID=R0MND1_NOSB1|nr:Zonadhesin [Nosema bombycis CQ1]|eukprot:EOB14368.1 Zonadhesin [Nosema bombycis CQ1]
MVSASTVSPINTPPINQDEESENMEFLFKEGEDTQKVLKKIPQNYHLSFKGNFKKYVAMKNKERIPKKDQQSTVGPGKQPEEKPKDESSKLPSMEPKFDQHKAKEKPTTGQRPSPKPQQPIFTPQRPKESSPKQQSQIKEKLDKLLKPEHPSAPKPQQPKDKPKGVKLPDGNQVNGMFKTILDQIKKLEDKKNTEKLHSLTIDLPQIAQPTSAALSSSLGPSSSSLSVSKTTTTQPPSTSTEVIYKTVYKYKDTPESSVKPKESTEKPKESTEKPKESTEQPKESTEKPKESTEKPKESTEKPKESTDKPKESTDKPKESTDRPKESTEKPKESTDKPKESTDKPKESTEKPKESSSIAYKTTKIGSYSILDSESRVKTITVTVLKDSITPSSSTRSVSPSVSSVLDFIDKPGTTLDHDEENLSEFDSKVKKLFKDLIDTKKKRRLFRLAPNLEKDTESRLKDYVRKLIDSEDPIEKDGVLDCSVIDIGEPAVD